MVVYCYRHFSNLVGSLLEFVAASDRVVVRSCCCSIEAAEEEEEMALVGRESAAWCLAGVFEDSWMR